MAVTINGRPMTTPDGGLKIREPEFDRYFRDNAYRTNPTWYDSIPYPASGRWVVGDIPVPEPAVQEDPEVVTSKFKGTTWTIVVLDKSGSMHGVRQAVITGFNTWKRKLAASGGTFPTTIVLFDSAYEVVVENAPIAQVNDLDETRYAPDGMTNLNDAIVRAVRSVEKKMAEEDRSLVCIVTDGKQTITNSEYQAADVRRIIKEKQDEGRWTFTYLSSSPTAWRDAKEYGVREGNTLSFDASEVGTRSAFASMARGTLSYAASASEEVSDFYNPAEYGTVPPAVMSGASYERLTRESIPYREWIAEREQREIAEKIHDAIKEQRLAYEKKILGKE